MRHDDRDLPRARRNDDLAFVLDRPLAARDAGDDVDLFAARATGSGEVAEIVLEDRPGALVQVCRLRNDVAEVERAGVIEARRRAVERSREVAPVDPIPMERAGAGVISGRVAGERRRQALIECEAVASVLGARNEWDRARS